MKHTTRARIRNLTRTEVSEPYSDQYVVLWIPLPADTTSDDAEQTVCYRMKFAPMGPFLVPFMVKDAHISVIELVEFLFLALLAQDMVSKIGLQAMARKNSALCC